MAIKCHTSQSQEDMRYDLEYAHVLGDELDTAEMRSINSLWRAPTEALLEAQVVGVVFLQVFDGF